MKKKINKKLLCFLLSGSTFIATPLVALSCKNPNTQKNLQDALNGLNIAPKKENGADKKVPHTASEFLAELKKEPLNLNNRKLLEYFDINYKDNDSKQLLDNSDTKFDAKVEGNNLKLTVRSTYKDKNGQTKTLSSKEFVLTNFKKEDPEEKAFQEFSKDLTFNLSGYDKSKHLPSEFLSKNNYELLNIFKPSKDLNNYKVTLKIVPNDKEGTTKLIATFSINGKKLNKVIKQEFTGFKGEQTILNNLPNLKAAVKNDLILNELESYKNEFDGEQESNRNRVLRQLFHITNSTGVNVKYTRVELSGTKFTFYYKYYKESTVGSEDNPNKKEILESDERSFTHDFKDIIKKPGEYKDIEKQFNDFAKDLNIKFKNTVNKNNIFSSSIKRDLIEGFSKTNPDFEVVGVSWKFIYDDVKGTLTAEVFFKHKKTNYHLKKTFIETGFKKDKIDNNLPELKFNPSGFTQGNTLDVQRDIIEHITKDKSLLKKYFDILNLQSNHNIEITKMSIVRDATGNLKLALEYKIYKQIPAGTDGNGEQKITKIYSSLKKVEIDLTNIVKKNNEEEIDKIQKEIDLKNSINKLTKLASQIVKEDFEEKLSTKDFDVKYTLTPNDETGDLELKLEFTSKSLNTVKKTIIKKYTGFKKDLPEGKASITRNENSDIFNAKAFDDWNTQQLTNNLSEIGTLKKETKDNIHWISSKVYGTKVKITYKIWRKVISGRDNKGNLTHKNVFTEERTIELDFKDIIEKNKVEYNKLKDQIQSIISALAATVIPEGGIYSAFRFEKDNALKDLNKALTLYSLAAVKNKINRYNNGFVEQLRKKIDEAKKNIDKVIDEAKELKNKIDNWIKTYNKIQWLTWDIAYPEDKPNSLRKEFRELSELSKKIQEEVINKSDSDVNFLKSVLKPLNDRFNTIEKDLIEKFKQTLTYQTAFLSSRIRELKDKLKPEGNQLLDKYFDLSVDWWGKAKKINDYASIAEIIDWWEKDVHHSNDDYNGKEKYKQVEELKKFLK